MTAPRSRKEEKVYQRYRKTADSTVCDFCEVSEGDDQFVEKFTYFKVIKNIFPYSIWDGQAVADHLMIVPLRHIEGLGELTSNEKVEYVDILQKYEKLGYNVFTRAPASIRKTIYHQHTHLIKPIGPVKKFLVMLRKPLIRIVR